MGLRGGVRERMGEGWESWSEMRRVSAGTEMKEGRNEKGESRRAGVEVTRTERE